MQDNQLKFAKVRGEPLGYNRDRHFIFHRLSNFKSYTWLPAEKKHLLKIIYPGMYDMADYLGMCSI
jgi:hypothetical protein